MVRLESRVGSRIFIALALTAPAVAGQAQTTMPQAAIVELPGAAAVRLNESGEIAGALNVGADAHAPAPHFHAAIHRAGGWQDLGVPGGNQTAAVTAINSTGAVAGFAFYSDGIPFPNTDNRWTAIWAPAGATSAEVLSGFALDSNGRVPDTFATGINDNNTIVGCFNRYDELYPDPQHAFVYANGTVTNLHELLIPPGPTTDYAYTCSADVNSAGDVVGYLQPLYAESRGFLYRGGVATRLEQGTSRMVDAKGINDAGQIVGQGIMDGFASLHAVVYDAATSTISSLGLEASGAVSSEPYDINGLGDVVGTMSLGAWPNTVQHAFLASGGQVFDLNDLVPADSEWVLRFAQSINSQGQIVGQGHLTSSPTVTRYFLVTLAFDPQQRATALIELVDALQASGTLNGGNANALIVKVEGAMQELSSGDVGAAINRLEAFINQVEAFMQSGKLTSAEGEPLLAGARRIIAELTS